MPADPIVQESPWRAEVLDCQTKGLKNLKFCKIAGFLEGRRGTLLEIGCGHGKMIRSLSRLHPDIEYTGCDINAEAIAFCQQTSPQSHFYTRRAEDVDETARYDFVLLADILEHVVEPERVLRNAHRAVRDGGYLILQTVSEGDPNIYSLFRLIKSDWSLETRGHRHYFTKTQIRGLVEQYFDIERVEYLYHALGSLFDASLFFATLNQRIRRMFEASGKGAEGRTSPFRSVVTVFDVVAFHESTLLKNVALFSSAQFIVARKRSVASGSVPS
jgi:SAM-dependent methyltransferase